MSSDQRRAPRYDADLPVQLQGDDGEIGGHLRNVSASGAAIEFAPDLGKPSVMFEIGDSVEVQTEARATARGIVVRHDANGIAVKFDKPEDDLLAQIVAAVQSVIERNN